VLLPSEFLSKEKNSLPVCHGGAPAGTKIAATGADNSTLARGRRILIVAALSSCFFWTLGF
jgi:hypothetical protein